MLALKFIVNATRMTLELSQKLDISNIGKYWVSVKLFHFLY